VRGERGDLAHKTGDFSHKTGDLAHEIGDLAYKTEDLLHETGDLAHQAVDLALETHPKRRSCAVGMNWVLDRVRVYLRDCWLLRVCSGAIPVVSVLKVIDPG